MANYEVWNRAMVEYFIAGAPKGSHIFLSVDEEALEQIASGFLGEQTTGDPAKDFVAAVRARCLCKLDTSVSIGDLRSSISSLPKGVAFLGLLVLAAYAMQEEEGIDESNYFRRLREILGLPAKTGRPDGLPPGAEEPLWRAWNQHLIALGFQPTAERGEGPQKYLRYVLSQAILRESDKQHLEQRFLEANLVQHMDCDQLGSWLSRQQFTRKHLLEGFRHRDPGRVWEFFRAAHRVYEAEDWVQGRNRKQKKRTSARNIECGLYRTEELSGTQSYWLFPKQPARVKSLALTVSISGSAEMLPLRTLRAGFYAPLKEQQPFVRRAIEGKVEGDSNVQKLLFPKRDFWILMRDPEDPYGAWATWKPYLELGEKFMLLCESDLLNEEMGRIRTAKLIDWERCMQCDGWIEYHDCMVLSYDWGGFNASPECSSLVDALTPRTIASISFAGGLWDPNQNAWLEGFAPSVKVYGFENSFEVILRSAHDDEVLHEEIERQTELSLPTDLEPGNYKIEASWNGRKVATRLLRIVGWANIQACPEPQEIVNRSPIATAAVPMRGALIIASKTQYRSKHA